VVPITRCSFKYYCITFIIIIQKIICPVNLRKESNKVIGGVKRVNFIEDALVVSLS
jgi:hypothetical protein